MTSILPRFLGTYKGRRYSRYAVVVTQSGIDWEHHQEIPVVAESPAAAVNLVRDEVAPKVDYPVEIETLGPKGGRVARFVGYESLIAAKMFAVRSDWSQLFLSL